MSSRRDRRLADGSRDRLIDPLETDAEKRRNSDMSEAAELWLCAYLGVSDAIARSHKPDRGYDLVLRDGVTVDAKWSRWLPGAHYGRESVGYPTLNLATWKQSHRAMLYALVIGETPADFDIYAWASGYADLSELVAAPLVRGRYGRPYHALGFDYLHPLERLR